MKIIFRSPNVKDINKHRDSFIFNAKKLFNQYYAFLLKDILYSISNNKPINIDNHKEDFKNLLKIIYKQILSNNKNSLFKNIITQDNKKSYTKLDDILNSINNIEKDVFNSTYNDIDKIADVRSTLIFTNLIDQLKKIQSATTENFYNKQDNLKNKLTKIENEINSLPAVPFQHINKEKKRLIKIKESLISQIAFLQKNQKRQLEKDFEDQYNEEILKNKSKIHAQNEVDNFEGHSREKEFNYFNNITTITIIDKLFNKTNQYAQWINPPMDERTRITHAEANGQIRKNGELFEIRNPKTNQMEYTDRPQGEGLSLENSINCRCVKEMFVEFTIGPDRYYWGMTLSPNCIYSFAFI